MPVRACASTSLCGRSHALGQRLLDQHRDASFKAGEGAWHMQDIGRGDDRANRASSRPASLPGEANQGVPRSAAMRPGCVCRIADRSAGAVRGHVEPLQMGPPDEPGADEGDVQLGAHAASVMAPPRNSWPTRGSARISAAGPCMRVWPSSSTSPSSENLQRRAGVLLDHQDRNPLGAQSSGCRRSPAPSSGEADRGFVEQHELGVEQETAHDLELLLLAAREGRGLVIALRRKAGKRSSAASRRLACR